jgi:ElaB/YqjD/DUF883 family membrane-anchored ribosome-binding protein
MQRERRLRNLMNDVEELLGELSTEANPDVQELRRRIADAIGDTKRAIAGISPAIRGSRLSPGL